MLHSDLGDTLNLSISLRTGALFRMGYDVVFYLVKAAHASFYLQDKNELKRDYAKLILVYTMSALAVSSVALISASTRDSKWLNRALPFLTFGELVFIVNCLGHDYLSCTACGEGCHSPPCFFSIFATVLHSALGLYGLSVIWSYAKKLEHGSWSNSATQCNACSGDNDRDMFMSTPNPLSY